MKDYFDLWFLMRAEPDFSELRDAIAATFERRKTKLPEGVPAGLSDAFAEDRAKQSQWMAFINRNKLAEVALPFVISELRSAFQRCGVVGG